MTVESTAAPHAQASAYSRADALILMREDIPHIQRRDGGRYLAYPPNAMVCFCCVRATWRDVARARFNELRSVFDLFLVRQVKMQQKLSEMQAVENNEMSLRTASR